MNSDPMKKGLLIFQHELVRTIRSPWYILMTLAIPLAALLAVEIYGHVQNTIRQPVAAEVRVGYVDQVGGFDGFTQQGRHVFVGFDTVDEATQALTQQTVDEYFVISLDYTSTDVVALYSLKRQVMVPADAASAIKQFLVANVLADKVPPASVAWISAPLALVTTTITEEGSNAANQGGEGNLVIPVVFAVLLIMSLSFASGQMSGSLGEEKENRLIEILLSSVSTRQLLVGKVLGLTLAGILQVAIWVVLSPILLNVASSVLGGFFSTLRIPPGFLLLAVVYFVLGYANTAVLMASTGAISPTISESQQLSSLLILPVVAPGWFSSLLIMNPDNPFSIALTIFPLTSPVAVMFRFGAADIPPWQLAASIGMLSLSIVGGLFLASSLFQTHLLSYGKRPPLREILRGLRR